MTMHEPLSPLAAMRSHWRIVLAIAALYLPLLATVLAMSSLVHPDADDATISAISQRPPKPLPALPAVRQVSWPTLNSNRDPFAAPTDTTGHAEIPAAAGDGAARLVATYRKDNRDYALAKSNDGALVVLSVGDAFQGGSIRAIGSDGIELETEGRVAFVAIR